MVLLQRHCGNSHPARPYNQLGFVQGRDHQGIEHTVIRQLYGHAFPFLAVVCGLVESPAFCFFALIIVSRGGSYKAFRLVLKINEGAHKGLL